MIVMDGDEHHTLRRELLDQNIEFFFELRATLKLYHWSTRAYSHHKATDKAIELMDELVDKYVEVYLSTLKRPYLQAFDARRKRLPVVRLALPEDIIEYIQSAQEYLLRSVGSDTSPALVTIRDDMLIVLDQLMYLLTFA